MISKNLESVLKRFPKAKVMVIGDVILDQYIWGNVERISPEAPVPVVWAHKRTFVPGGAANVAHNIRSLDGTVCLVVVIGKDKNGDIFKQELKKQGICADTLFVEPKRYTTVKTRIIAGHQQIVRVDWEDTESVLAGTRDKIIDFVKKQIKNFDAVIIEDYGKGVINQEVVREVIDAALSKGKVITVDPKEDHFGLYRKVTSITPNRKELENAIRNLKIKDLSNSFKVNNDKLSSIEEAQSAAHQIMQYLNLESVLVTLGENGMLLVEKEGAVTHIPTVAQEVFDVSGAGDTVISTFTLALCAGASKQQAAYIANFAAGIVVGKVGTAVTNRRELLARIKK